MNKTQLISPDTYKVLTPEEKKCICNGCGAAGSIDFVMDTILGVDISEACNIHDFMYYIGETELDKKHADEIFFINMNTLINENKSIFFFINWLRKRKIKHYYFGVKKFGYKFFNKK